MRHSPRYTPARGFTLIELLIVVAIIGIIAAIAIPNLLRARVSANEAQAIGDTRTVMSANATYAAANCGLFAANMQCMTNEGGGAVCIPNYIGPQFLGGDLGRVTPYPKSGYLRDYVPNGVAGGGAVQASLCDVNSLLDYCYVSTPASVGLTGVRGFLGGSAGTIFQDSTGAAIACPVPAGTANLQ